VELLRSHRQSRDTISYAKFWKWVSFASSIYGGDSESVADFGLPSYACEGLLERGQGFRAGSFSRAASALQLA
jgi:hypothetical protein